MNLNIFAIRDSKTAQYANPMFLVNTGHAIRVFADEVNRPDENNMLNKHPEDFQLYQIGEYDTDTGIITSQQPRQIVTADEVIKKQ